MGERADPCEGLGAKLAGQHQIAGREIFDGGEARGRGKEGAARKGVERQFKFGQRRQKHFAKVALAGSVQPRDLDIARRHAFARGQVRCNGRFWSIPQRGGGKGTGHVVTRYGGHISRRPPPTTPEGRFCVRPCSQNLRGGSKKFVNQWDGCQRAGSIPGSIWNCCVARNEAATFSVWRARLSRRAAQG